MLNKEPGLKLQTFSIMLLLGSMRLKFSATTIGSGFVFKGVILICSISENQIQELQVILENLRNQLTVIKGFIQISSGGPIDFKHEQLLIGSVNDSDLIIGNAIATLEAIHNNNK